MKLQDVVDLANAGELSNLGTTEDVQTTLGYINLGMLELYKRFTLDIKEHVIELEDGVEIYTMPSDFMWVVSAYGEVDETSVDIVNLLPLNVEDDPLSINTVSWNKLQIPLVVSGAYISVIYVASPKLVTESDLIEELELPPQLIEALLHYVGYRAHMSMDGNVQAENNTHYQRFEAACVRAKADGVLTADDMDMSARFSERGFV